MTHTRAPLAVLLLLVTCVPCFALGGSATLRCTAHLKVQRCGGFGDSFRVTFQLRDDGTWVVASDTGTYSGTYAVTDDAGRKLALAFDADSEAGFVAGLAADASELCRTPVTVGTVTPRKFGLTFNRRHTRAKLSIRLTGTGTGGGRSGTATWRLQGAGRFTAT